MLNLVEKKILKEERTVLLWTRAPESALLGNVGSHFYWHSPGACISPGTEYAAGLLSGDGFPSKYR